MLAVLVDHGLTNRLYRPSSSTAISLTAFLDELSDLLTHFGAEVDADRYIVCDDFSCRGASDDVKPDLI